MCLTRVSQGARLPHSPAVSQNRLPNKLMFASLWAINQAQTLCIITLFSFLLMIHCGALRRRAYRGLTTRTSCSSSSRSLRPIRRHWLPTRGHKRPVCRCRLGRYMSDRCRSDRCILGKCMSGRCRSDRCRSGNTRTNMMDTSCMNNNTRPGSASRSIYRI